MKVIQFNVGLVINAADYDNGDIQTLSWLFKIQNELRQQFDKEWAKSDKVTSETMEAWTELQRAQTELIIFYKLLEKKENETD